MAYQPPAYEPRAYEPPAYEPPTYEPPAYEPAAYEPPGGYQSAPTDEPLADEPAGADEAVSDEPGTTEGADAAAAAAPLPLRDAEPADAPHIEPWSPDADPWGAAWTVPSVADEAADDAAVGEADEAVEPGPEAPDEDEGADNGVAAAAFAAGALAPLPDIEVEAEPDVAAEPEPEAELADEAEIAFEASEAADREPVAGAAAAWNAWDADIESAPSAEAPPSPPIWTPEPEAAEEVAATEGEPIEAFTAPEPTNDEPMELGAVAAAAATAGLVDADAGIGAAEAEPVEAEAEAAEAEAEPAEAEAEAAEAEAEAAVTEVAPADAEVELEEPEPVATEVEEPDAGDAEPVQPESPWDVDLWSGSESDAAPAAAVAAAAEPVDDARDEPAVPTELAAAAAAMGLTSPERGVPDLEEPDVESTDAEVPAPAEEAVPEAPWSAKTDATEVFPTTWSPPPPPPPSSADARVPARATDIRTTFGRAEPEVEDELAEDATTAEQAVPWLIGVILLLAGMVIVLLALIFAGDGSLGGGGDASPTPAAAIVPSTNPSPQASSRVSPSPSPRESPNPSASAKPVPKYGDLEMIYQGRATALEPIYLLRKDFTVEGEPEVLAQDADLDVRRFAWSPDGRRGAFLYADLLAAINPGVEIQRLSDGISAITFGDNTEFVYAVRVRADGGNDVATILAVNEQTGHERELDRVSYPRPALEDEPPLAEAQFADDGGSIRLFWMQDDTLYLWILGGGAWTLDPAEGNARKLDEEALPVLYAAEGERTITLTLNNGRTTLRIIDRSGDTLAQTRIDGRVSHLRWSPRGDQVVFTLGRSTPGGGVLQNLYLWNLGEERPVMITNTGAAFGAEWRGSQNRWEED